MLSILYCLRTFCACIQTKRNYEGLLFLNKSKGRKNICKLCVKMHRDLHINWKLIEKECVLSELCWWLYGFSQRTINNRVPFVSLYAWAHCVEINNSPMSTAGTEVHQWWKLDDRTITHTPFAPEYSHPDLCICWITRGLSSSFITLTNMWLSNWNVVRQKNCNLCHLPLFGLLCCTCFCFLHHFSHCCRTNETHNEK